MMSHRPQASLAAKGHGTAKDPIDLTGDDAGQVAPLYTNNQPRPQQTSVKAEAPIDHSATVGSISADAARIADLATREAARFPQFGRFDIRYQYFDPVNDAAREGNSPLNWFEPRFSADSKAGIVRNYLGHVHTLYDKKPGPPATDFKTAALVYLACLAVNDKDCLEVNEDPDGSVTVSVGRPRVLEMDPCRYFGEGMILRLDFHLPRPIRARWGDPEHKKRLAVLPFPEHRVNNAPLQIVRGLHLYELFRLHGYNVKHMHAAIVHCKLQAPEEELNKTMVEYLVRSCPVPVLKTVLDAILKVLPTAASTNHLPPTALHVNPGLGASIIAAHGMFRFQLVLETDPFVQQFVKALYTAETPAPPTTTKARSGLRFIDSADRILVDTAIIHYPFPPQPADGNWKLHQRTPTEVSDRNKRIVLDILHSVRFVAIFASSRPDPMRLVRKGNRGNSDFRNDACLLQSTAEEAGFDTYTIDCAATAFGSPQARGMTLILCVRKTTPANHPFIKKSTKFRDKLNTVDEKVTEEWFKVAAAGTILDSIKDGLVDKNGKAIERSLDDPPKVIDCMFKNLPNTYHWFRRPLDDYAIPMFKNDFLAAERAQYVKDNPRRASDFDDQVLDTDPSGLTAGDGENDELNPIHAIHDRAFCRDRTDRASKHAQKKYMDLVMEGCCVSKIKEDNEKFWSQDPGQEGLLSRLNWRISNMSLSKGEPNTVIPRGRGLLSRYWKKLHEYCSASELNWRGAKEWVETVDIENIRSELDDCLQNLKAGSKPEICKDCSGNSDSDPYWNGETPSKRKWERGLNVDSAGTGEGSKRRSPDEMEREQLRWSGELWNVPLDKWTQKQLDTVKQSTEWFYGVIVTYLREHPAAAGISMKLIHASSEAFLQSYKCDEEANKWPHSRTERVQRVGLALSYKPFLQFYCLDDIQKVSAMSGESSSQPI